MTATPSADSSSDAPRLAYLETAIWRAYYGRRWASVLCLTLQLVHDQFGLAWPRAVQAAYYTTRAALAWAPVKHDVEQVRRHLVRFYAVARTQDAARVAELELRYWIVHRELSGRPAAEKGPLEAALAELHAALFGLPLDQAQPSGVARARAADDVDEITSGRSRDVAADWARVERHLREAYGSIAIQLPGMK